MGGLASAQEEPDQACFCGRSGWYTELLVLPKNNTDGNMLDIG
jgi:hypothetical protein